LERAAGLLTGAARARAEHLAARWLAPPAPPATVAEPDPVPSAESREVLGVIGRPEEVVALETTVALLDPTRSNNLLLTGPTGAGKRVFAERLVRERLGLEGLEEVVLRRTDPQMLVSLLMGTRRGEFTGAVDQAGAIQRALHGRKALLLDELHTLDRVGQEILLPLLELPRRRFGGLLRSSHEIDGPLQIILATNVDVSGSKWRDRFRSDLWFRMSQLHVHLPSLAERGPEATAAYFERMLAEEGFDDPEEVLEPRAMYQLLAQPWEGNLRELHAAVRRLARFRRQQDRRLTADDLPRIAVGAEIPSIAPFGSRDVLETLELNAVIEALRRCDWNQSAAAEHLAISKYRLHRILQKHDLIDWVRGRRKTGSDPDTAD
jgi:DNA-binding NtrC family response regulator